VEASSGLQGGCHIPAFLGALAAGLSAFPAVVHVVGVVFAFVGTGIANQRTECARLPGKLAVACQEISGQVADFGTTPVQLDAGYHHVDLRFVEASLLAALARNGAVQAGVDAVLQLMSFHSCRCFVKSQASTQKPGEGRSPGQAAPYNIF
jgi:hypothetical protein